MGQVCARHNEYYEDRCRWCEAPETDENHCCANAVTTAVIMAKEYDERLRLAMTPPNDGHGIFE